MLIFNYGNWQFWGEYNPPLYLGEQKVTFDGINKLILVNEGVTELNFQEDVYSAWKEWLRDPNQQNAKYIDAISAVGGDPLPGARALGATFFLENGWRMRTWNGDHELTLSGNAFTREGDPLFVTALGNNTITINLNTSTLVETIFGETNITAGDIAAIAAGVWANEFDDSTTAEAILRAIPDDVWNYVIDTTKGEIAREKLRKIATKTQDIALR